MSMKHSPGEINARGLPCHDCTSLPTTAIRATYQPKRRKGTSVQAAEELKKKPPFEHYHPILHQQIRLCNVILHGCVSLAYAYLGNHSLEGF